MAESILPRLITVRVKDGDEGYCYDVAFLIHPTIAMSMNCECIEFYKVKQLEDESEYEMVSMLDPWEIRSRQGINFAELVQDASLLSFGEFWDRYLEVF